MVGARIMDNGSSHTVRSFEHVLTHYLRESLLLSSSPPQLCDIMVDSALCCSTLGYTLLAPRYKVLYLDLAIFALNVSLAYASAQQPRYDDLELIPIKGKKLGIGTCQHIQFSIHMKDKMLIRSYTPTRPILESEDDGTIKLTIKTYFSNDNQPGGAFSNFLYALPIGEQIDVNGLTSEIEYLGGGRFIIEAKEITFSKVSLIVGGSGLTPGYQLIAKIWKDLPKLHS